MKQILWLFVFSLTFYAVSQERSNVGVSWTKDLTWSEIREKAKKENKYIFIDAYTTWCAPCKKMDKDVYPDKVVGDALNSQFISVKVQMDKTDKDNELVKRWYSVAREFNQQFGIDGYPSFLFFNPNGQLVHKGLGLKDVPGFIELVKDALTDPNAKYQRAIEKFRTGQLDFNSMPDLARRAKEKKDKKTAVEIAKKFKSEYLDRLNDNEVFTKTNLFFLAEFSYQILESSDRYFQFFKNHTRAADSIIDRELFGEQQKLATAVVKAIIKKEEIDNRLYDNGKPIKQYKPNWDAICRTIEKKYGSEYIDITFTDYQIDFYYEAKDWKNYVKYVTNRIEKYPPRKGGKLFGPSLGDAFQLNHYAWWLFLECGDKSCLKKALEWSNLAIAWEDNPGVKADHMDTKANLLYRMGEAKKAIELEEEALSLAKDDKYRTKSISSGLKKMKEGLPTWSEKK